jgi:hypothetical protein
MTQSGHWRSLTKQIAFSAAHCGATFWHSPPPSKVPLGCASGAGATDAMKSKFSIGALIGALIVLVVSVVVHPATGHATTVNSSQSLLMDGTVISLIPLGSSVTISIQTTAPDAFDGLAGGDYSLRFISTSNVLSPPVVLSGQNAGDTVDSFTFTLAQTLNAILVEASAGASFDVDHVSITAPFAFLGFSVSFQGVAAPYSPTVTPLPGALPLFAAGLGAFGFISWRRKRKHAA